MNKNVIAREDVVRSALLHYIHNGLARDIRKQNMECYPHMRFIDCVDGVVRVVIGGEDPQMNSTISRDVFIDGFVRVFVRPLLLERFPDLEKVSYIKTTSEIYDMAVNLLGGRVEYANFWTSPHSFYECMKLFGDNHPSVQGCLKATFAKEGQTSHNNYTGSTFTTPSFFNRFSMG